MDFQEAGQVVWSSHLFQNFPQFVVIHTVKGFGIVNKAEVDVSVELSCFIDDPTEMAIWPPIRLPFLKPACTSGFIVHVLLKPDLENFEPYFTSTWDDVMPKSWNLPMTTRELTSDAKARESLLPSSSWGSHPYRHRGYREESQVLDYIAYRGSVHEKKKEFLGRGMSDWSLSFEGFCVGFWLVPIT